MPCFTRIYVLVENPSVWNKLQLSQFNVESDSLRDETSLIIEDYYNSRDVAKWVVQTANILQKQGIIIADCAIENDTFYIYYLGDLVQSGAFYASSKQGGNVLYTKVSISDVHDWLKYIGITIDNEEEKPMLEKMGIRTDGLKLSMSFDDKADFYEDLDNNEDTYKQQIKDILLSLDDPAIEEYKNSYFIDGDDIDELVDDIFDDLPDAVVEDDHRYNTLNEVFEALKNGTYKGAFD